MVARSEVLEAVRWSDMSVGCHNVLAAALASFVAPAARALPLVSESTFLPTRLYMIYCYVPMLAAVLEFNGYFSYRFIYLANAVERTY
jgi:hypothetical protein